MAPDPQVGAPDAAQSHLVLVGLMGTGKSTVGARLARRLDRDFLDNDVLLEARTGATAATLRRDRGEPELHRLEAEVLLECLARRPYAVIAAAASTVLCDDVRDALRRTSFVIWLRADVAELDERLDDPGNRPLSGNRRATLQRQNDERAGLYGAVADVVIDTSDKDPDAVVNEVFAHLDDPPHDAVLSRDGDS
jgi:shikimate kinase